MARVFPEVQIEDAPCDGAAKLRALASPQALPHGAIDPSTCKPSPAGLRKPASVWAPSLVQMFTVKMSEGVLATSYGKGDKFFIDPQKLLPLDRFLPRPKGAGTPGRGGNE